MNIASIITYIIAIVSYLGLIIFAVVGIIRAYRSMKTEYMVYHRQVIDKLNGIDAKIDNITFFALDNTKDE